MMNIVFFIFIVEQRYRFTVLFTSVKFIKYSKL